MENSGGLNIPNVFIIGAGRSGTTLLSNLLQNHPEILSLPEATFIFGLYPHFGDKNIKDCIEDFISSLWLRRDYNKSTWQIDEEKLRNLLGNHTGPLSFSDACKYCFFSSARANHKSGVKVVINKHPEYTFYIPLLIKLFPESKFIVLIRDYRDRYLSVKENLKLTFYDFMIDGISWNYVYKVIGKSVKSNPDRFITIKYEDLITSKDQMFNEILRFLNLDPNVETSLFNKYKGEFKITDQEHGETIANNFNKVHKNSSREIMPDNYNKWQGKLITREVKALELFCGDYGIKFGYKKTVSISLFDKLFIYLWLMPLLILNAIVFYAWKSSFFWPLYLQGKIYQLAKKRANLS